MGAYWKKGLSPRDVGGFVTDGPNDTYILTTDTYPTTRNGVSFGWYFGLSPSAGHFDLNSSLDPRLASEGRQINDSNQAAILFDVPSDGRYQLRYAMGSATDDRPLQGIVYADIGFFFFEQFDYTADCPPANFFDAQRNLWSAAAWPTMNQALTFDLVGGAFIMAWGSLADQTAISLYSSLAYFSLEQIPEPTMPSVMGADIRTVYRVIAA